MFVDHTSVVDYSSGKCPKNLDERLQKRH